ncbi:hypothetical protein KAH43_02625 [Candidatus Bipolaricaulota bacterium]|nr:hypothetical protein [Candidatus Bipolaricaulota bacterium]
MPKHLFAICVLLLLFSTMASAVTDDEVSAALALFPDGQDVAVMLSDDGRMALESAIETLETALGIGVLFEPANEDAYMTLDIEFDKKSWINMLSQGYYTLGDVFLKDDDAKKAAFVRGQYWGLKSLRMSESFATEEERHGFIEAVNQETDVAALFWTYGNWSRKDEYDPLGAIARNDPPKLEALIDRVFAVNDAYSFNAPYRALAAFWGGLPSIPLYTYGQNLPRALSYICPVVVEPDYCDACSACPVSTDVDDYFENRLVFAQYYLMELELWDEAARVLQSILDDVIGETFPLYNAYCVELAKELLDEVSEQF